jgi:hypothetical protein
VIDNKNSQIYHLKLFTLQKNKPMIRMIGMIATLLFLHIHVNSTAQNADNRYFEMRTYTCNPEKRPDLIKRFQDHTLKLLKKHDIDNVAYFLPTKEDSYSLTFIIAYPSQEMRDKLWNEFGSDPKWKKAAAKSEENGKLVAKVDQTFMTMVPELSTAISPNKIALNQVFELRTYTCLPNRHPAIKARFRDHTRALFEKHGMKNVVYWESVEKDGTQPKLIYLLSHSSEAAAKASFDAFRIDPEWIKASSNSELDGKIVQKVESVFLKPLPFSPLK